MKKVLFGVIMAMVAVSAQASYLWWQVDTADFDGKLNNDGNVIGATMYAFKAADKSDKSAIGGAIVDYDAPMSINIEEVFGSESVASGYSFYVELTGYDSKVYGTTTGVVGVGEVKTYAQLASSITSTMSAIPSLGPWHGGAYTVPEPTSAMMMMVGVALMALRRRKE